LPLELARLQDEIKQYALDYGLDFFETIFELLDYDELNAVASLGGFPVRYPHWRFGMEYDYLSKSYTYGLSKIYELVINNDPAYAYLMRSNALIDQKLVMCHVYAHVDFFKNNFWFSKTNRKMIDTMANNAIKIRNFMDEYGVDVVENFIDKCLSIENLIDPYSVFVPKKSDSNKTNEGLAQNPNTIGKLKVERSYMDKYINPPEFLEEQKKKHEQKIKKENRSNVFEPQKDILKFLIDYAPLEDWQRTVLSIIRDEAYYYAPQRQTKIMNEGWASYWHSKIMTEKALKDSEIIDFAEHHSGVTAMAPGKINPYKIGLELFRDIEDRWNKGKFGKEYEECDDIRVKSTWDKKLGKGREKIFEVRRVCNDITFIDEYMTEEFCERLKLYNYQFNKRTNRYEIVDRDYKKIKERLLLSLSNMGQPLIELEDDNFQNKGELLLVHRHQGLDLDSQYARETMKNIAAIWGRSVNVQTESEGQKKLFTYHYKSQNVEGEFTEKFI
jgi:stage V sporulation protein R